MTHFGGNQKAGNGCCLTERVKEIGDDRRGGAEG